MLRLLVSILLVLPGYVFAGDINCGGKITIVMGGHSSCDGYVAFRTDDSSGKWICSKSKDNDAVILAGFMADKTTYTAASVASNSCADLSDYHAAEYVILYK